MDLASVSAQLVEAALMELAELTPTAARLRHLPQYGGMFEKTPYLSEYKKDDPPGSMLSKKKGDYCGLYVAGEKVFLYFFGNGLTDFHLASKRIYDAAFAEAATINSDMPMLSLTFTHQLEAFLPYRLGELGLPKSYFQRKAKWLLEAYKVIRIGGSEDERSYLSHEETIQNLFLIMRQGDVNGMGLFRKCERVSFSTSDVDPPSPKELFQLWRKRKTSRGNRRGGQRKAQIDRDSRNLEEM